jgi:hypothetical protein
MWAAGTGGGGRAGGVGRCSLGAGRSAVNPTNLLRGGTLSLAAPAGRNPSPSFAPTQSRPPLGSSASRVAACRTRDPSSASGPAPAWSQRRGAAWRRAARRAASGARAAERGAARHGALPRARGTSRRCRAACSRPTCRARSVVSGARARASQHATKLWRAGAGQRRRVAPPQPPPPSAPAPTPHATPRQVCETCQRPFTWRKVWEKCWDEVTTCSDRCKSERKRRRQAAKRREQEQGGAAEGGGSGSGEQKADLAARESPAS